MTRRPLADRVRDVTPKYQKLFDTRGGITPVDPLQFHLYHLARYWSRLIGFCRQEPSIVEGCVESDLGACVQVGSEFTDACLREGSQGFEQWKNCWEQTQAMLHNRPVTLAQVEAANASFEKVLQEVNYDPWGRRGDPI